MCVCVRENCGVPKGMRFVTAGLEQIVIQKSKQQFEDFNRQDKGVDVLQHAALFPVKHIGRSD